MEKRKTKINHYEWINWENWKIEEIDFFSNGCWSARGMFRPPYAKQYSNICNRHDIRYMCWGNIFRKFWADFAMFIEMFLAAFTYVDFYLLGNILRVVLAFLYFIWVWVFGTIIDALWLALIGYDPAFKFWKRRKRSYFITKNNKNVKR